MAKVYLSSGHGGADPGAVSGGFKEKDINLVITLSCMDYLVSAGVEVMMESKPYEDTSINDIVKECNRFNPNLAVEIHNNAGGGDGFEVYHTRAGGTGKLLSQNIEEQVIKIGQNSRGVKTKVNQAGVDYYGFIRATYCPAVIVECAFLDHPEDLEQIDTAEEQKSFGIAIAKGILKTLGISEPSEDNPSVTYKVQVGAFKSRANAENLKTDLQQKGYAAIIVKA